MKKFLLIFFCCTCLFQNAFGESIEKQERIKEYPKMDLDFKIYLPTALGFVTGNNAYLSLRENYTDVDKCINFLFETRGTIISIKKFTFSWSFGSGAYIERNKNTSEDLMSMNLTLGSGIYYHPFSQPTFDLNGLCCYVYPVYSLPVYSKGYKSFYKWKSAIDIGYNLTIFEVITIYPFIRNIFAWSKKGINYGFDCGLAIGFYFHDPKN